MRKSAHIPDFLFISGNRAESCDIPVYALKALVNHTMGTDVTAGYIIASPERLREPQQKVTDKLKAHIGLEGPQGNVAKLGQ